jgi:hypothetical protein
MQHLIYLSLFLTGHGQIWPFLDLVILIQRGKKIGGKALYVLRQKGRHRQKNQNGSIDKQIKRPTCDERTSRSDYKKSGMMYKTLIFRVGVNVILNVL